MSTQGAVRRNSVATLQALRDAGEPFALLTAYDRATAELAEAAEIPQSSLAIHSHRLHSAMRAPFGLG